MPFTHRSFVPPALLMSGLLLLGVTSGSAAEPAATVEVVVVERAAVDEIFTLIGTVTPTRRAALSARTDGLVARVKVDAGARVERGDALLELDDALGQLAVEGARAALEAARLRLRESERRRAETDRLLASQSIPQTEADARAAEVGIESARVNQLDVELRRARELLERHMVVAPFAGVVGRKLTEAGEWVATGTPVLELVGTDELRVDVQVPQERFAGLHDNVVTRIFTAASGEEAWPGRILARVPVGAEGARTFLVRIGPAGPGARLVPGMSARVEFQLRSEEPVLAVPRDALVRRPDGTVNVWVATRTGEGWRATQRRVEVGRRFASTVEIRTGLEPGDQVVVRGNETLRENQPLDPRPPAS